MSLELTYAPDLSDERYQVWAADVTAGNSIDGPPPEVPAGYTLGGAPKPVGSQDIVLPGTLRESYFVFEGRNQVGDFEIFVPVRQTGRMDLMAHLALRDDLTLDQQERLVEAFDQFDPAGHISAFRAMVEALGDDLDESSFEILFTHSITRVDPRHEDRDQVDAMRAFYANSQAARFYVPGVTDGGWREYAQRNNIRIVDGPRPGQPVKATQPPLPDTLHVREVAAGSPIEPVLEDIISDVIDALGPVDCDFVVANRIEQRIVTLFSYPEFKIEMEPVRIKIGCVRITITLPVFYMRISDLNLWAFLPRSRNVDATLENILRICLIRAVIGGAVVGIVTQNFAAALAAFRIVFIESVKYMAGRTVECLIPELALIAEAHPWHRVI